MKFLHIFGPDTKNSYGIMSQLHKYCDLTEHSFLITAYESVKKRFPKLGEFPDLIFIPEDAGRIARFVYFYRQLRDADVIILHSLYFTTQKYIYFLFFFRKLLKKAVWIEWGADLYVWKYNSNTLQGRIRNYIGGVIRRNIPRIGCCFPTDEEEVRAQFGENVRCYYTPLANPKQNPTGLIEEIMELRPPEPEFKKAPCIQIAHNSFQFNNHMRIIDYLSKFKDENAVFVLPLNYGIYGINGQYGGKMYRDSVIKYAQKELGEDRVGVLLKSIPFDRYLSFLWNIDVVVFDFDRPSGLGTLRILLLMEKKVYIPAGTPYYDFLRSKGLPIYDTRRIPEMTFEEFMEPPVYTDKRWLLSYMNNRDVIQCWLDMFDSLKEEMGDKGK